MPAETLAIIDGHYYAFRFHFGMPFLTGPDGRPTGITFAYANLLKELRTDPEITHWIAVFDAPGQTFRDELYDDYKAHRPPAPEPLVQQLPDVERLCAATGIPVIAIPGFEADDVVATLAQTAAGQGLAVRILSKDKDLDQVLSDRIRTWDPGKGILRGPAELKAEKGLNPGQVIDYLCMIGDSSDNVPGIDGVGPKTAVKLLDQYGSLDSILAHVDELKGKQKENVAAFIPKRALTRDLITLRAVPDLPDIGTLRIDPERALDTSVYSEFGFSLSRFTAAPTKSTSASDHARTTILDLAGVRSAIVAIRAAGRVAFDTETTSLDPLEAKLVGLGLAWGEDGGRGAVYIPFQGTGTPLVDLAEVRPLLIDLFTDTSVRKLAQNAKYDVRILAHHGIPVHGLDGDTMLASWLLDPARESHGLDYLTKTFLGESKIPTSAVIDLAAGQTMAEVPVTNVAKYCCEDAQCTWRLGVLLETQLAEHGLDRVYREQEVALVASLAAMEDRGIAVDRGQLDQVRGHLAQYLESVKISISRITGPDFNPASPKQVGQFLFEKLKLPVISKTKSGPSTDASVLEALRHQHELPDLLLQYRQLSKLIGTYLDKLPGYISARDGRIHTNFKGTGAETGRLASDQPNLQNIPKKSDLGREIRTAFIAGPGRIFLAADYSQIELRVLAHFSGDPTLRQAFAQGDDIHRFVAAQVAGVEPDQVTPQQRNAAKAVNFGIIYGQTAFGLSQQLGIPRGQAQRFIDDYFARFSKVKEYIASVVAQATDRGWAETMAGRRRHIPQLASQNRNERLQGERVALNSTIQGSAADLIKRAMLRCDAMLPKGSGLILQIHDELLVEAEDAIADQAASALHDAMTGAWVLNVPLIADVRRGRTWFDVS